jgi:hypothetical protein
MSVFVPPPLCETPGSLLSSLADAQVVRIMCGNLSAAGDGVSLARRDGDGGSGSSPTTSESFLAGTLVLEAVGLDLGASDCGMPIVFILKRGRVFGVVEEPDAIRVVGVTSV